VCDDKNNALGAESSPYTPSVLKYKQKWVKETWCIWFKIWTRYIHFCWPNFAFILYLPFLFYFLFYNNLVILVYLFLHLYIYHCLIMINLCGKIYNPHKMCYLIFIIHIKCVISFQLYFFILDVWNQLLSNWLFKRLIF
jgi:hypothetical protein